MRNRLLVLCLFLSFAVLEMFGQGGTGTITGIVTDQQGAVVPNAQIEAKNSATGQVYPGASSAAGVYTISQVPPGVYDLTVKAQGFKTYTHKNMQVQVAVVLNQNVPLEVGQANETVTVTAEATLLQTETGDLATNITVESLDNLPILGIGTTNSGSSGVRNPYNMLQLIPGVGNYTANSEMMINGLGGFANTTESFRVEGQDATNHLPTGYAVQENQPSADAIQEVAIQTSNYAAEYGTAGAAVINLTMKSGTNQFHGSAYDYFVNEDLNAGIPFTISGGPGSPTGGNGGKYRPRNRRNDYGGTIGGPIWIPKIYDGRNRTFFFFNLERYIESNNYAFNLTVPTPAYLAGDFSAISPNGTCSLCAQYGITMNPLGVPTPVTDPAGHQIFANEIFNPNTRVVNNGIGTATPFLNNMIPSSMFDPVAVKFEALFPKATNSNLTNNATGSILGHRNSAIPAIKVDHSISAKDKISYYYSKTGTEAQIAFPFGNADGLPIEIGQYRGTFIYGWTHRLNYDRSITPTLLLHLGVGFERVDFGDHAPFLSFDPAQFGLSNFLIHRQFPSVNGTNSCGTGCTTYGGMQPFGTVGQIQTYNRESRPTFNANVTKVKGSHTFKIGAEAAIQGNLFANFAGVTLNTGTAPTSEPFIPGSSLNGYSMGFGYASFLLGDYTSTQQTPQEDYRYGKGQYALFVQDSWKVTRKLTLDYGIRYDLGTATKETYGRVGKFSATTPNPLAGNRLGSTIFASNCGCDFYAPTYPYAVGPRLGVAYQITPKTVFRGGWGVVYQYTPDGVAGGIVGSNAVNTVPGINSFVNTQQPGFIQTPVWPVTTNPYPNPGTLTGAPVLADANFYRPPRLNQWSVGLQEEVTRNLVLEASYVANRQVWVPIGIIGNGPLGYLNQVSPSHYAAYGLFPYPGTGPGGNDNNYKPTGLTCSAGNDCDRALLSQTIGSPIVMAKLAAAGVGYGGLLLPYAGAPTNLMTLGQALTNFPQYPNLNPSGSPTGDERYDSLQAKVTKRLSHNLQASGAFTWQKSFLRGARQDFWNPENSVWALQNIPPRVLTFNATYTTPKIEYLETRAKAMNQLVKDWQIGWFADYQSGTLLTPPTSNVANFLPSEATRVAGQPLYLKGMNCGCINPYTDQVLNPLAWKNLPSNLTGTATSVLYTDFRGPRHPQENANIARNFRLSERFNLQFRGEFVNIFNRTLLPNPITNVNPSVQLTRNSVALTNGFGVINAYNAPNAQPATTTSAQNGGPALAPRTGTLVLRLTF
jgi:hypothetical protein